MNIEYQSLMECPGPADPQMVLQVDTLSSGFYGEYWRRRRRISGAAVCLLDFLATIRVFPFSKRNTFHSIKAIKFIGEMDDQSSFSINRKRNYKSDQFTSILVLIADESTLINTFYLLRLTEAEGPSFPHFEGDIIVEMSAYNGRPMLFVKHIHWNRSFEDDYHGRMNGNRLARKRTAPR